MSIIYINDHLSDSTISNISATDRGLLLGDGLFETIRAYHGTIPFLAQHWERFIHSANALDINVPITLDTLTANIETLIQKNQLENKQARIRVTLTRGVGAAGLTTTDSDPTLIISTFPYTPPGPVNNIILASIRRNELSPLANIKSLNYLDNILALQAAYKHNADDALFLNTHDNLTCSTSANVFIVLHGKIYTPRIADGVLPGIMRNTVVQLAKMQDIEIHEMSLSIAQLCNAEEIFLTNSLVGVRSVLHFNGSATSQTITQNMQHALNDHVEKLLCKYN